MWQQYIYASDHHCNCLTLLVFLACMQLEYKRMLVGLLVHLVTCGYVVSTIRTMHSLFQRNRVDVSIARHFVTEASLLFLLITSVRSSAFNRLL